VRWWDRLGAWEWRHRFAVDTAGTLAVAAVLVVVGAALAPNGLLWSAAVLAPLPWRRVAPAASAAAVYSIALAHLLLGGVDIQVLILPADLAVLVALYSVTAYGPRWAYRTAMAGAVAGGLLLGAEVAWYNGMDAGGATVAALLVLLSAASVFTWALFRRSRREQLDALVERARRLEAERDQQATVATIAERTRIAREMHDIVAHSLSVIIAQADGGRYAAEAEPAAAVRSLATISETGRAALTDMRRLLGVLRPGDGDPSGTGGTGGAGAAGTGGSAPSAPTALAPQPAVDEIHALVEHVKASGLAVSLVRTGTPRRLPPGTGLSVYRICQESLTNVLKHAGPQARVTVLLQWQPAALVLEVSDDGRGAAAVDGHGHGLTGMRERATMLGGTLSAGPRPGGGYRVRAEIPLPPVEEER
jgi:signal transduction histidine kinase